MGRKGGGGGRGLAGGWVVSLGGFLGLGKERGGGGLIERGKRGGRGRGGERGGREVRGER